MQTYAHKWDDIQKIINYAPLYTSYSKDYLKPLILTVGTRKYLLVMPL